jgi:DNA replication regulator DPB11
MILTLTPSVHPCISFPPFVDALP